MKLETILRSAAGIGVIILAIMLVRESGLSAGSDDLKRWMNAHVLTHGVTGSLVFVAACALMTGMGFSRQVFAFAGGYAFGVGLGSVLVLAGEMGGVILAYFFARFVAADAIARKYPARVGQIRDFLSANPFLMTLAIRLLPISNNLVVNLLAGVTRIPVVPFMAASALGHLPQTVVFALLGSGLVGGIALKGTVALVLFGFSVWIGYYLFRKYRRDRDLDLASEGAPVRGKSVSA